LVRFEKRVGTALPAKPHWSIKQMNVDLVETTIEARRNELFADMAEHAAKHLMVKHAFNQNVAVDVGNSLADFVFSHWNGQSIYISSAHKISKRDMEIYHRMGRGKAEEIAKEYDLSFVRVYQIHRRVLATMRTKARSEPDRASSPPKTRAKRPQNQGIQMHNFFGTRSNHE
jgi:Mor family transcriptional regulator